MTEHTASLEPIEIFRASDERITHWVDKHLSYKGQFRSPDSPPSAVEEIELGSHHSDEGSSHSLPPKMVLKYPDGRGDIPISHWHYDPHYHRDPHYRGPAARSRPQTPHQRSKSAMGHRPPPPIYPVEHNNFHYHSEKHHGQPISPDELHYESTPEDIKILPADPNVQPQRVTGSYRPRRSSEPFREHTQTSPNRDVSDVFDSPPPRYISNTLNIPVVHSHSQHIHDPYSHHHPSHTHSRGNRPPPPIVYAPGRHHNTDHFAPPAIVHGSHKPPGMNHAGSSPTGPQYPRITTKPYPVHSQLGLLPEEQRYGPRGPRPRDALPRATPISESTSGSSNSTYYILPNAGQKVKVLNGPEPSLYNGSSTTKSTSLPRTPDSAAVFGLKRPLFSRLISFASDFSRSSKGSRSSRKNLHRRHSIDVSARSQSRDRR